MSIALKAEKRENLGRLATKKIKKSGSIPAIIYSKKGNINISLNLKEFENEYLKGDILTSIIELQLNDKKIKVIAHKVELDPVSDRPIHIDFTNCEENKLIRAQAKFSFVNQEKSPAIKKAGLLHIVLRRAFILCDNEKSIPKTIDIDIGEMHLGHKIRAHSIKLPAGVKFLDKTNFLIGSLIGRGKSEEEKSTTATTATDASAVASPAATASASGQAPAKKEEKKPEAKK